MKSLIFILSIFLMLFDQTTASQTTLAAISPTSLFRKKEERFLLITGCARSGTTYISRFLCRSGIDVPHEAVGAHGSVSWPMTADSFRSPWGPPSGHYAFTHTFHQVRDPLKTISSVYATEPQASWNFIQKHISEINPTDSKITKCAKYWIYWNLMAEEKAEWTYRIENLPNELNKMEAILGMSIDRTLLNQIPKDLNTRCPDKKKFTWADMEKELEPKLLKKMKKLAERYGYPITDR